MGKRNEDFNYEIDEYLGSVKESDKHDWCKSVVRISWGDNPPTLDIRNINMKDKRIGKGISFTNEETDRLVDLLVNNDYGSIEALKNAIRKRESIYSISDSSENEYYTIGPAEV